MSKGSGGGGHGGGGSGGGAAVVQGIIAEHGGVTNFASIPYRPAGEQKQSAIDHYAAQLAGAKTVAEKNKITSQWKPISMGMAKRNGTWKAGVEDGTHRIIAAKQGGATRIRAEVTCSPRKGQERTITTMVKL